MGVRKGTYFYHVMKTGGRSIISAFLYYLLKEEIQKNNDNITYTDLYLHITGGHVEIKINDSYIKKLQLILCKWNSSIKNKRFKFGFNHDFLGVKLPRCCYTITCIREPLERLLSHYRMLLMLKAKKDFRETPSNDCRYIMKGIQYFVENFPKEYLIHQLYFFSKKGDVGEAFNNVTKCTQIILTEKMQEGYDKFYAKTNIQLQSQIVLSTPLRKHDLNGQELAQLKRILHKEYEFYYQVLGYYEQG